MKLSLTFEESERLFSLKYELQRTASETRQPAVLDAFETLSSLLEEATLTP